MYILDQYRGTSVSCRYDIPAELVGPESRSELVRAVEAVIGEVVLKHPVLHVGIANGNSKRPTWVQLDSLDLRNHVTWQFVDASEDLDRVSQEVTASEVDGLYPDLPGQPGWRIVILHQEATSLLEILFTWNHPHCDGISGKIFQEDVARTLKIRHASLEEVHSQDTSRSSIIKLPAAPPNLPPPIEDACKLPISIGYTLKMIWEELGPASFSWTRPSLARWAPYQLSPYKTQFRAFTVGHNALSKILSACRKHKTTLTGLLHSLTLVSLAAQFVDTTAPAFESGTTVDLRRFLASNSSIPFDLPPERTMGNYVTILAHIFDEDLVKETRSKLPADGVSGCALPQACIDHVWSVAAKVRGEIEQKLEMGLKNDAVGVMKFVGDWRDQMTNAAKRPRQFSWWVTGVGVLDGEPKVDSTLPSPPRSQTQYGPWIVRRAQFAL